MISYVIQLINYVKKYEIKDVINTIISKLLKIVSIILVLAFITFKKGTNSILLNTITNDSIFSAIDVISSYIESKSSESKFYEYFAFISDNIIYPIKAIALGTSKYSLIDRYIFYTLLSLSNIIIDVILWGNYRYYIYILMMLSTYPYILDKIIEIKYFQNFLNKIYIQMNKFKTFTICSLVKYSINKIFSSSLSIDYQLNNYDIKPLIKHKNYEYLINFIKVFLITTIIQYLEHSKIYYARIIKLLYNYGALMEIDNDCSYNDPNPEITDNKTKIVNIIENKKWKQLCNPHILKILIKLYSDNKSKSFVDQIKEVINYIEIKTGLIIALYSIGSLFEYLWVPVLISLILLIQSRKNNVISFLARFFALVLAINNFDILTIILISETFEYINNKIFRWILFKSVNKIIDTCKKKYHILFHKNNYNLYIILSLLITFILLSDNFKLLNINIFIKYVLVIMIVVVSKYPFIILWYIIIGNFSNYYIIHMLLISCILYLTINIANFDTAPKQNIKLNIVENYNPYDNNENIKHIKYNNINLIDDYLNETNDNTDNKLNQSFFIEKNIDDNINLIDSYYSNNL
jgi:hypothetical protein